MLKSLSSLTALFICIAIVSLAQDKNNTTSPNIDAQLAQILAEQKADSTDKTCQQLMSDYYQSFESDEGLTNPLMSKAMLNLFKYNKDPNMVNGHLARLLYQYIKSVSDAPTALAWVRALKVEYKKVYGGTHPLIYLFEGESLINDGQQTAAHDQFVDFQTRYHDSVVAMCYVYQTESDKAMAKTWLSVLKKLHPNHWIVKKYKD